jgi:hypothetical protein
MAETRVMKSLRFFQPSDASLVKRALQEQQQAFELLVERYQKKAPSS